MAKTPGATLLIAYSKHGVEVDFDEVHFRAAWGYAQRRINGFRKCHGIIPAVVGDEAIAIPFTVKPNSSPSTFKDWNEEPIQGWIKESESLWASLGFRLSVTLQCSFGSLSEKKLNLEDSVVGSSFGLPILVGFGRDCAKFNFNPQEVICTGKVSNSEIHKVGGVAKKYSLAKKLGAKYFFWVGEEVEEDSERLAIVELVAGSRSKDSIFRVFDEILGAESARRGVQVLFDQNFREFDKVVSRLSTNVFGRKGQVGYVRRWIQNRLKRHGHGIPLFIGGESGCGKSAFVAKVISECRSLLASQPSIYFAGETGGEPHSGNSVVSSIARQAAYRVGFDWGQVKRETNVLIQFEAVMDYAKKLDHEIPLVFFVDGLDELTDQNLADLCTVIGKYVECVWILSGQPHRMQDGDFRSLDVEEFEFGRISLGAMRAYVDSVAPSLADEVKCEIVKLSEGLPIYTRVVLESLDGNDATLTLDDLPRPADLWKESLDKVYSRYCDLSSRNWRELMIPTLVAFAEMRVRFPVGEDFISEILKRMNIHHNEESLKRSMLGIETFIEKVEFSSSGTENTWRIRHGQFGEFLINDPIFSSESLAVKRALSDICCDWENEELGESERQYAARFLVHELKNSGRESELGELAMNEKFLNFQVHFGGVKWPLLTIEAAIDWAVRESNFLYASELALRRASWIERLYRKTPIEKLREQDEGGALEAVSRLENQDDRTLWLLVIAADHSVGGRPVESARILDEHLERGALREDMTGGKSLCAAALLCLLIDVPTARFNWGLFLARLTNESKEAAARSLARSGKFSECWAVLGSIQDAKIRDRATLIVIRELAEKDPDAASRELGRLSARPMLEYGREAVVCQLATRGQLSHAKEEFDKLERPFQKIRALGVVWNFLPNIEAKKRVSKQCWDLIKREKYPEMKSKLIAELGRVQASYGNLERAEASFLKAFNFITKAGRVKLGASDARNFTHVKRAESYRHLASCIGSVAHRFHNFKPFLEQAIEGFVAALNKTSNAFKADQLRIQLIRLLGRYGYGTHTNDLLREIKDPLVREKAIALRLTLRLRFDLESGNGVGVLKNALAKARNHRARLEIAGTCALELQISKPAEVVATMSEVLFFPKSSAAWRWGEPLLLGQVCSLEEESSGETDFESFNVVRDAIERKLYPDKRAWPWLNFAKALFEKGAREKGRLALDEALKEDNWPKTEVHCLMIQAESGFLQKKFEVMPSSSSRGSKAFEKVWHNRNSNLLHTFKLMSRIIERLTRGQFDHEAQQICEFVHERVASENYELSRSQRLEWAGEFAARLSSSVERTPILDGWLGKFIETCRELDSEDERSWRYPASAARAEAVSLAETEFEGGFQKALKISSGKEMSKALRDIAINLVRNGQFENVVKLCTEMVNDQSEHIGDIADALSDWRRSRVGMHATNLETENKVVMDREIGGDANDLLRWLLVAGSHYLDSAFRVCATALQFSRSAGNEKGGLFFEVQGILEAESKFRHDSYA